MTIEVPYTVKEGMEEAEIRTCPPYTGGKCQRVHGYRGILFPVPVYHRKQQVKTNNRDDRPGHYRWDDPDDDSRNPGCLDPIFCNAGRIHPGQPSRTTWEKSARPWDPCRAKATWRAPFPESSQN